MVAVGLVGCTAQPHGGTRRGNSAFSDLPVVRVRTAHVLSAGVPVSAGGVLSANTPGDDSKVAAVDGIPAIAAIVRRRATPTEPDFRRFIVKRDALPLGPLHEFGGAWGDEVVLAGFDFDSEASPIEVLRTPPTVVHGNVADEVGDSVIVRVPMGSYAGFVGGPAGEYRAGHLSVWGVVEKVIECESTEFVCLSVRKLPEEVLREPGVPTGRRIIRLKPRVRRFVRKTYGPAKNSPNIAEPPVPILHIGSGGVGSGFAVTADLVVTAGHVATSSVIAVDGLLARVLTLGPNAHSQSGSEDWRGDWAIARTNAVGLAHPLPLDEREELPVGQRVIIGGFPGPLHNVTLVSFMEREPVWCEGIVRKCRSGPYGWAVWIDVALGDYAGMSGGPVVTVGDDGQMRLWGLCIGGNQVWIKDWITRRTTVVAIPIPRELEQYAPGIFGNTRADGTDGTPPLLRCGVGTSR